KGNKFAGAGLIALGINIKLLPLVLIPYLVYRREYKTVAYSIIIYAGLLFLPVVIIGWERNMFLIKSWYSHLNPMNQKNLLDVDERSFHGLSTLLATLLVEKVPDKFALPVKRNIANLKVEQLNWILNMV